MENILLFGGNGKLGKHIIKQYDKNIYAPSHNICDVTVYADVKRTMGNIPELKLVINAAALVGTLECEQDKNKAWKTNVIGAMNVAKCCHDFKKKLVYISSNLIFDGKKGNYSELDKPSPKYFYGLTKVAGEKCTMGITDNHSIIRLDFFPLDGLKYNSIYIDHYTSKISVSEAASKILIIAVSDFTGIINIGRHRASLFEILKEHYPCISPIKISESSIPNFPKDLSFNLEKWRRVFGPKVF
jgi:dTDP-4-dehydrorhamnose reductase